MPIYELQCDDCGAETTELLNIDETIPPCPCGGQQTKLISTPGVCRVAGPSGPITDVRQVWDTHGKNWRDRENKNPYREGGARKRIYSR